MYVNMYIYISKLTLYLSALFDSTPYVGLIIVLCSVENLIPSIPEQSDFPTPFISPPHVCNYICSPSHPLNYK